MRLLNRFRKIGAYFKESNLLTDFMNDIAGAVEIEENPDDYGNEYGNEYGNDYEGGEKENAFIDIEAEHAN